MNNKKLVAAGHGPSEVTRYSENINNLGLYFGIQPDEDGIYVSYSDYAALKAERDALAAEMSAVEAIHDKAVSITDDDYDSCPKNVQQIIRSLAVMQIPATDAFANQLRAEGVDLAVNELKALAARSESEAPEAAEQIHVAALYLMTFAAQLRDKGGNNG